MGQTYPVYARSTRLLFSTFVYLKCHQRKKDGKVHRYWSILESHRLSDGRTAKRQVLYLGEINDSQRAGWCRFIEAFETGNKLPKQIALFPEDRQPPPQLPPDVDCLNVDLRAMQLRRPRQWGACWLTLKLWQTLRLDQFFEPRLPVGRKGTPWCKILQLLACNRFIAPGSEWFVHRHWYRQTALSDLLGLEREVVAKNALYHCHDRLLQHKEALFKHLRGRWEDLFNADFEILLYDLTSVYFECDPPLEPEPGDKRKFGYSRDKRPDCVQVVIALVVTTEGYPLAYEVMDGNTQDKQTLRGFLDKIQSLHGKARRIWVMDRGIPTEEVLEQMRASDPPVHYLVGTPRGRLSRYEKRFLDQEWREAREGVEVKQTGDSGETYLLARSAARVNKERAMRIKKLKGLVRRLKEVRAIKKQSRDELMMRLGAAKKDAGKAWRLMAITVAEGSDTILEGNLQYRLDRGKLRQTRRREGAYLLRAFVPASMGPEALWKQYMGLVQIEESFKTLKGDLSIRPIQHQLPERIEAHIFISFLAYCLHVTLKAKLQALGRGLSARSVLEKFASVQMIDVHLPITDSSPAKELVMARYTQPDKDLQLLLGRMGLELPPQPPPRIEARQAQEAPEAGSAVVGQTF